MSNQLSISKLRAEADALCLEGEKALNFVYKQQEFYRNKRAAKRTTLSEEAERIARAAEADADRATQAAEAKRVARAEEREAEIEHEVRAANALERKHDKA